MSINIKVSLLVFALILCNSTGLAMKKPDITSWLLGSKDPYDLQEEKKDSCYLERLPLNLHEQMIQLLAMCPNGIDLTNNYLRNSGQLTSPSLAETALEALSKQDNRKKLFVAANLDCPLALSVLCQKAKNSKELWEIFHGTKLGMMAGGLYSFFKMKEAAPYVAHLHALARAQLHALWAPANSPEPNFNFLCPQFIAGRFIYKLHNIKKINFERAGLVEFQLDDNEFLEIQDCSDIKQVKVVLEEGANAISIENNSDKAKFIFHLKSLQDANFYPSSKELCIVNAQEVPIEMIYLSGPYRENCKAKLNVNCKHLMIINQNNSMALSLEGTAESQNIRVYGACHYDASQLQTQNCSLTIHGACSLALNSKIITGAIYGAVSYEFLGTPDISQLKIYGAANGKIRAKL